MIVKCLRKCGFMPEIFRVVDSASCDSDQVDDIDDDDVDDDSSLAVLRMSHELFAWDFRELVEIDHNFNNQHV